MCTYVNKRGKTVNLVVSNHAYKRFIERYPRIFGDRLSLVNLKTTFNMFFQQTKRVQKLNHKEQYRIKKNGNDSMFFRTNDFTFVVKNATVVTVEISAKGKRHLNKAI